jgi:uncharacterized repeat protein (TIGR01451 family)
LSLGKAAVQPGDTVDVSVTVANPGPALSADVLFGALLPPAAGPALGCPAGDAVVFLADAFTRVVVTCQSAPSERAPLLRGVTLPAGLPATTVPLRSLVWPPGVPSGLYTFFLALTPPTAPVAHQAVTADVLALTTASVVAVAP